MVRIAIVTLLASSFTLAFGGAPPQKVEAQAPAPPQPAPPPAAQAPEKVAQPKRAPARPVRKLVTITDKAIELADPIYFATGKADILPDSFKELDAIVAALAADKKITLVEIGVHTDARGSREFNRGISQKRAESVLKYLVDHGVEPKRLRAIGYGETRPLDTHSNEAAWAKNRRTELVILQRTT